MLCVHIRIASSRRFWWVHSTYNHCVENRKDFPKLSLFPSWTGAMINPQWLELPMIRTNFYGWSQSCSSHWGSTVVYSYKPRWTFLSTVFATRYGNNNLSSRSVKSAHTQIELVLSVHVYKHGSSFSAPHKINVTSVILRLFNSV